MSKEVKKLTEADVMTGFNPVITPVEENPDGELTGSADDGTAADQAPPPEPELAEVRLDGRAFQAPKELAEAFTKEINRRDGTRGAELQQLRERVARMEGVASTKTTETEKAPAGPPVPDPELQIENPAKYQQDLLAYVTFHQERKTQALAEQYEQAEAAKEAERKRQAAWGSHVDAFYSKPENEVLRKNRDIVELELQKHFDELATLDVEAGFARLGELARQRIASLTGVAPEVRARQAAKPLTLEGSNRRGTAPVAEEPEGPRSLTQAMKDRRRAQATAFSKGGSGPLTRAAG